MKVIRILFKSPILNTLRRGAYLDSVEGKGGFKLLRLINDYRGGGVAVDYVIKI